MNFLIIIFWCALSATFTPLTLPIAPPNGTQVCRGIPVGNHCTYQSQLFFGPFISAFFSYSLRHFLTGENFLKCWFGIFPCLFSSHFDECLSEVTYSCSFSSLKSLFLKQSLETRFTLSSKPLKISINFCTIF